MTDLDLYYLRSILRQLQMFKMLVDNPSIPGEALADNVDWLDCFIAKYERKQK
jgi:hypothetical protein